ncbi:substrate-binding periplasmic protein [Spartinivicinus ruber]|uniref:substrate-binding periplasmic protein n=1 Tax=Spartinivicinus ruber TaxID=2683272 RepID=UPI0013D7E9BB|nr:transporter substrate-binding domain-containing protein [Spartinivicinus ruber]
MKFVILKNNTTNNIVTMKYSVALLLTTAFSCAFATECKTIKVSGDVDYPPITWQNPKDKNEIKGLAIQLVYDAFSDSGIKIESVYAGDWGEVQNNARIGKIDIIAGLYINEERKQYLDYTEQPFLMDPVAIFVPSKKAYDFKFSKWEDLKSLQGVTTVGNSFGQKFDKFSKKHLKIKYKELMEETFDELLSGNSDYLIQGLYPGLAGLARTRLSIRITPNPVPVVEEGLYIAFSKRSHCKQHIKLLSNKVSSFVKDKISSSLVDKYFKVWKEDFNLADLK